MEGTGKVRHQTQVKANGETDERKRSLSYPTQEDIESRPASQRRSPVNGELISTNTKHTEGQKQEDQKGTAQRSRQNANTATGERDRRRRRRRKQIRRAQSRTKKERERDNATYAVLASGSSRLTASTAAGSSGGRRWVVPLEERAEEGVSPSWSQRRTAWGRAE
jgi:hypothetical protein